MLDPSLEDLFWIGLGRSTLGGSLGDSEMESGQKMVAWGSKLDDVKAEGMGCQRRLVSENWMSPLTHDSLY